MQDFTAADVLKSAFLPTAKMLRGEQDPQLDAIAVMCEGVAAQSIATEAAIKAAILSTTTNDTDGNSAALDALALSLAKCAGARYGSRRLNYKVAVEIVTRVRDVVTRTLAKADRVAEMSDMIIGSITGLSAAEIATVRNGSNVEAVLAARTPPAADTAGLEKAATVEAVDTADFK